MEVYHEYTSAAGGNIFFPASCSFFRKRFRSRNSLLSTSSFNCASQLSSNDWISNASRSFCSGVSFSTHFSLSNLGPFAAGAEVAALALANTGAVAVVGEVLVFGDVSLLSVVGEEEMVVETFEAPSAPALAGPEGEEKNEVMEALALGFFAVDVAMSAALRLRGVAMMRLDGLIVGWRTRVSLMD